MHTQKTGISKMAVNTFRQIDAVFTIICIAVAIFFTAHCIYQYCKNEDSSVVTFSEYHSGQDTIYPGLTLCFRQYYRKETFSDKNEKDAYLNRYLEGKTLFKNNRERKRIADRFNRGRKKGKQANQEEVIKSIKRKFEDLYHNNTAIIIEDYLLFGLTKYSNAGMAVYEFPKNARWKMSNVGEQIFEKQGNEGWKPLYYPSPSDIFKRCWTFEIPFDAGKKIEGFGVMFNKSIFYEGSVNKDFEIRFSYPKQQWTAHTRVEQVHESGHIRGNRNAATSNDIK